MTALRIANSRGIPGTAGPLVLDARGVRFALACHHVLYGDGAVLGDRVWALPSIDEPEAPATLLGRTRSGVIGRVTFRDEVVYVDCALVELERDLPPSVEERIAPVSLPIARLVPGLRVFKDGSATDRTEGTIADVAYPDRPLVDGRVYTAPNQILVDPADPERVFSAPGDSGAALFDERGAILGLVWGSNAIGQGIACPIEPVLERLEVSLAVASRSAVELGNRRSA